MYNPKNEYFYKHKLTDPFLINIPKYDFMGNNKKKQFTPILFPDFIRISEYFEPSIFHFFAFLLYNIHHNYNVALNGTRPESCLFVCLFV